MHLCNISTPFLLIPYPHPLPNSPGLSGSGIEYDKKILLAIKASCPSTHLPLRIADARPKLNANANAMAGKGFENVSFMGGSTVVSLVFMDIDNIHVMRGSLGRIKEGFACHSD
ncbi:hypothetical protein EON63_25170, partial [archaeon]